MPNRCRLSARLALAVVLLAPSHGVRGAGAWDCRAEDRNVAIRIAGSLPARIALPALRQLEIMPRSAALRALLPEKIGDAELVAHWQDRRDWLMRIAFLESAALLTIRTRRGVRPGDNERPFSGTYRLTLATADISGRIACGL